MVYSSWKCVVVTLDTNIQEWDLSILFKFHGEFDVEMSAVENIYDQIDGVAMGSPLGPVLANIFMCHFEVPTVDLV